MSKQGVLFLPIRTNAFSFTGTAIAAGAKNNIFTAGADDSDVKAILVTSNDAATVNLQLYITRSAVDYLIGTVAIPTLSGTNGAAPTMDLINSAMIPGLPVDNAGKRYLPMKANDILKVAPVAIMTGTLWVCTFGYDY